MILRPGDLRRRHGAPLTGVAIGSEFAGDHVVVTATLADGSGVFVQTRAGRQAATGEEFGIEVAGPVHFVAAAHGSTSQVDPARAADPGIDHAATNGTQPGRVSPPIGASTSPE